jgi:hypothetical protein
MKTLHQLSLLAATLLTVVNGTANAEVQFGTRTYGIDSDFAAGLLGKVVTPEYARKFPVSKWRLFIYADADTTDRGDIYCHSFVGVVPIGEMRPPKKRYSVNLRNSGSLSPKTKELYAMECAEKAVARMMSDRVENMYVPY